MGTCSVPSCRQAAASTVANPPPTASCPLNAAPAGVAANAADRAAALCARRRMPEAQGCERLPPLARKSGGWGEGTVLTGGN